jgi:transcriptional regulator with XRE-family HTH domain
MHVGYKVKKVREIRNLTQQYVADKIGLSLKQYGKIENGQIVPDEERLSKIAESLDVSVDKIKSYDENVILNNTFYNEHGANVVIQNGLSEEQIGTYERLIEEKDKRIALMEEQITLLKKFADR